MEEVDRSNKPAVLVTGGSGYIGSHVCVELIKSGLEVVVVDSLENSSIDVIKRVNNYYDAKIHFYFARLQSNVKDIEYTQGVRNAFENHNIIGVIHMAGFKSVKESVKYPMKYYENNFKSTLALLKAMDDYDCRILIFSSSATVYGEGSDKPCKETDRTYYINPYGETKLIIEKILDKAVGRENEMFDVDIYRYRNIFTAEDIPVSNQWAFSSLRYFNPIGADASGVIGDDPNGVPENLVPYIMKVLSGDLEQLTVFGNDYNTNDGTAIRDYIHITDLAKAHVLALSDSIENDTSGHNIRYNIGTGIGYSVLDVINVFEDIVKDEEGVEFNWVFGDRREGDSAMVYADCSKARTFLGFEAKYDLVKMCTDAWNFWKSQKM